jgi:hypothetical protein
VKQPVFSFEAEILTDAPYGRILERLRSLASPAELRCLAPFSSWLPPEETPERLSLRWVRIVAGSEETGELRISPDPKGAHLRLEGRMKGWSGFLFFGLMRWRADRLLDRFVEEL